MAERLDFYPRLRHRAQVGHRAFARRHDAGAAQTLQKRRPGGTLHPSLRAGMQCKPWKAGVRLGDVSEVGRDDCIHPRVIEAPGVGKRVGEFPGVEHGVERDIDLFPVRMRKIQRV